MIIDAVFIVDHGYPYTGEGPDELCICLSHERAVKEIKKLIRRNEYNGAGIKMPKKAWKRVSKDRWHWQEGTYEEYISITKKEVLE